MSMDRILRRERASKLYGRRLAYRDQRYGSVMMSENLWSIWRDFTCGTTRSWRMRTPIGILAFKTKKEANMARALYEKQKAERLTKEVK